jgi:hypothetical protein
LFLIIICMFFLIFFSFFFKYFYLKKKKKKKGNKNKKNLLGFPRMPLPVCICRSIMSACIDLLMYSSSRGEAGGEISAQQLTINNKPSSDGPTHPGSHLNCTVAAMS